MKLIATIATALALALALAALAFVIYGRERSWALLAGPHDTGRYDFAAAPRSPTGNDALACSPGLCARADFELPVYENAPEAMVDRLAEQLLAIDPLARRLDDGSAPAYARFVTFSPLMRFPDIIDIKAASTADGRTGLMICARARLGRSDFGKNRERIERLMAAVDR